MSRSQASCAVTFAGGRGAGGVYGSCTMRLREWLAIALLAAPLGCRHAQTLSPLQLRQVHDAMLERVKPGGPNHLHMRRLFFYAPPFAQAAQAQLTTVQAAALLHDATKEDGAGEPKERFCTHGEQGAHNALAVLLRVGARESLAQQVASAVREHMGPLGHNDAFGADRFMTRFCARPYPAPQSVEAQVLYDLDMLDLMTVDGVLKVVGLRQRGAEFGREPLVASALTGADSAWKSVLDAQQTLRTPAAQACGASLAAHTKRFLDGLDFEAIDSLEAFAAKQAAYLKVAPLPACLPVVPPLGDEPLSAAIK